ncbi:radical SAM protein [Archaeoglobales archaeon]|nr:MAG: radical SAM protein [Archaeoglobales archaeon]
MEFKPSYLRLYESGELDERVEELYNILESCELCPRKCGVNRLEGEKGFCEAGKKLMVSSYFPHFGEEDPLVGIHGSGTIFLTHCNLKCIYCQNYEISHLGVGELVSEERVARMMLELQALGCHNINFVTPTHYTPQLVRAIRVAAEKGLKLPIVWNCGGYENVEIIKLLHGIVDIYMPDIKYSSSEVAKKYSDAPDYFERCKEAVKEMHRQVGDLKIRNGVAYRGLLIRHLVLPNNLAGSEEILKFIRSLSKNSYVNIMAQYRPEGEAFKYKELNRRPTRDEFMKVIELAKELGLTRGLQDKHLFWRWLI